MPTLASFRAITFVVAILGLTFGVPAAPAASFWTNEFGPDGIDAPLEALVIEAGGAIVAGGPFTRIGGVAAAHVARWDGAEWNALGPGPGGAVRALALHEGELVAAGAFTGAIATWDGANWAPHLASLGAPSGIEALASWNDLLVAGGSFTTAGGAPAAHLAAWDGASWSPLGGGTNGAVHALAVDGADLIAGGSFTMCGAAPSLAALHVASWDGSGWSALGAGIPGTVESLAEEGGTLVAGGTFAVAPLSSPAPHLLSWDGAAWNANAPSPNAAVLALAVDDNGLVAGGAFTWIGETTAAYVATREGGTWSSLDGRAGGLGLQGFTVFDLAEHDGALFAAGLFEYAGPAAAMGGAAWNGVSWSALESAGLVSTKNLVSVASVAGTLVACGNFVENGAILDQRVASWDGAAWTPIGAGINSYTWAYASYGGALTIGGVFTSAGGAAADHVATWDGAAWTTLGASPPDGPVFALAPFGGALFAGGSFNSAGGAGTSGIAIWDGATWAPVSGGGVSGVDFPEVNAFAIDGATLVAAGDFTSMDGVVAHSIARWDGGTWSPVGAGIDGPIQDVAIVGGALVAAGVPGVFRWDGAVWRSLDIDAAGPVLAVAAFDDAVYVGGSFLAAGGVPSGRIARWDGGSLVAAPITGPAGSFAAPPLLLSSPFPNPFRGSISFRVSASRVANSLRVTVHDAGGRLLRILFSGNAGEATSDAGAGAGLSLSWDGRDNRGRAGAPGVYFLRAATAAGEADTRRVVRLR